MCVPSPCSSLQAACLSTQASNPAAVCQKFHRCQNEVEPSEEHAPPCVNLIGQVGRFSLRHSTCFDAPSDIPPCFLERASPVERMSGDGRESAAVGHGSLLERVDRASRGATSAARLAVQRAAAAEAQAALARAETVNVGEISGQPRHPSHGGADAAAGPSARASTAFLAPRPSQQPPRGIIGGASLLSPEDSAEVAQPPAAAAWCLGAPISERNLDVCRIRFLPGQNGWQLDDVLELNENAEATESSEHINIDLVGLTAELFSQPSSSEPAMAAVSSYVVI